MSVYKKLNEARKKFHSLKLEKTGHNKFAGYKYFELADFLVPALGVFEEVGLLGVVSFTADIAFLHIVDVDDPAGLITITSPMSTAALKGCHEIQNLGAVQTYLRRYLWVSALEIVEHDAIDSSKPVDSVGVYKEGDFPSKPNDAEYDALVLLCADSIVAIQDGIRDGDLELAKSAWAELDEDTKVKLWKAPSKGGCFTTVERQTMKSNEWNAIKLGE